MIFKNSLEHEAEALRGHCLAKKPVVENLMALSL
jgi:hypothetical protein